MRNKTICLTTIFILTIICASAFAQSFQISSGLTWLYSVQTPSGNWPQALTSDYYSTATSLDAVSALDPANPASAPAFQWMKSQVVSPTDYLSRQIIALSRSGQNTSAYLTSLLLYRTADGGFGGGDGYPNNDTLDTALALQALKAANYPDLSVINAALAYLTNSQNPDGGWGFRAANGALPADPSNIYMTAIVSATLQQFPQTATIANAITKATAYLIPMQNAGGGFGTPSSTIYETSLAYSALVGASTGTTVLINAINYLTSSQLSNGSWNDDPYSTALALKALYLSEHIPTPPPAASTTGSVMGTIIDATTKAPVANASVQLTGDPSHSAVSDAKGMFAFYGIPSGSQQITVSSSGYAAVTITASISAGTFINVGNVELSVNPTTGTVMGIVWNKDRNTPFGGVTVQVDYQGSTGLPRTQTALSAADGSYKITGINPGMVTAGTPQGPAGEGIYWNVPVTGTLAAGGIFIYNPQMSQTHPPFVNVYAETDKALYRRGDTVSMTFRVQNNRSIGYGAVLNVKVTDPSGAVVHTASANLSLVAKQMSVQTMTFILPENVQGGFYTVTGEVSDANEKIGAASATFGIFRSSIVVTPALPVVFSQGTNMVSFSLVNTGNYAVTSGSLNVTLTDPDGRVIATAAQAFTLAKSESKTLTYVVASPAVKFGSYVLSYTQSDETTSGQAVTVQLGNTAVIAPLYDKPSYRALDTAILMLGLANTGRFLQDGATLTVAVPDANFTDTRTVSPQPAAAATMINYAIPLPAAVTAGQHAVTITLALPSGSTMVHGSTITIPESSLSVSLAQTAFSAGAAISPAIANNGGVNTSAQYTFSLYDSRSALISSQSGTQAIPAGSAASVNIGIPAGAVDGNYSLVANCRDIATGKTYTATYPVVIAGVKGTLSVRTDKPIYLMSDAITSLSTITNSGIALQNGTLTITVRGLSTLPQDGLRAWFRADSGVTKDSANHVSRWADLSGNNFDLIQTDSGKMPLLMDNSLNGRPTVSFDGANDILVTSGKVNLLNGAGKYSTFVVVNPGATQKQWADILDYDHFSCGNFQIQQYMDSTNKYYSIANNAITLTAGVFQIYGAVFENSGVNTVYRNGLQQDGLPEGCVTFAEPSYFSLGNKVEEYPRQFNGAVAEVLVYNRILSKAERAAVVEYLARKYAIDASLPGGSDIYFQSAIPVTQALNSTNIYAANIGTLGLAGKMYLQGTLTSSTSQTIATAEYPFYIIEGSTALSFATDKKVYKPGETVTINGTVSNLAAIAASALNIQLSSGGQVLYAATADVPAGGSYPFTVTTPAGGAGVHPITGLVTQNTSTLALVADQYQVALPVLTAAFSAPDMAGAAPFNSTLTLNNTGIVDATVGIRITDDTGRVLQNQTAQVSAGQAKVLQYPLQQARTTTYTAGVTGDLNQTQTKTVTYDTAAIGNAVSAAIVTDKVSYNANEQVALLSRITSTSSNAALDNMTAMITIGAGANPVFTEMKTIAALMPGAAVSFNGYWNTGKHAPGNYPVTLVVRDARGTVLASSAATLAIRGTAATGGGLAGSITATPALVRVPANETVTYSLTNNGNEGIPNVTMRVLIVNPATQTVEQNADASAGILAGQTVTGSTLVQTGKLASGNYLSILQAVIPGLAQPKMLGSSLFTVEADTTPPVTTIAVGTPKYEAGGMLFISGTTVISLSATDDMSGVARTEYRLDGGAWTVYAPFSMPREGAHLIEYRSADRAGNIETPKELRVTADVTPPKTVLTASDPLVETTVSAVSPSTRFSLSATDGLSGVKGTEYRIDNDQWRTCPGSFTLAGLPAGPHTIAFRSKDNVLNAEADRTIEVRLIVIDVTKKLNASLNVLVAAWRTPPAKEHEEREDRPGKGRASTEQKIDSPGPERNRVLDQLEVILASAGIAYHVPEDRDDFTASFRSGRYNLYILPDAEGEVNQQLRRELGEAVFYGDSIISLGSRPHEDEDEWNPDRLFGVRITGRTEKRDVTAQLSDSPIDNGGTIETSGKSLVTIVTSSTAGIFGTIADKHATRPAIIFNQYGRGRAILYAFDLLACPDQTRAISLLISSLNYLRPLEHRVRALDSAPVSILLRNSAEPVDVKVFETLPEHTTADTITPNGTRKDNAITWLRSLAPNETARFGYYLNLPDLAGDYTAVTGLSYGTASGYAPYGEYRLTLTVPNGSSDLLRSVIADAVAIAAAGSRNEDEIEEVIEALSSVRAGASDRHEIEVNIGRIVRAIGPLRELSVDTTQLRLKLDELLRIWEKKWFLAVSPVSGKDRGDHGTSRGQ